jgi:hypothetical protein
MRRKAYWSIGKVLSSRLTGHVVGHYPIRTVIQHFFCSLGRTMTMDAQSTGKESLLWSRKVQALLPVLKKKQVPHPSALRAYGLRMTIKGNGLK